MSIDGLPARKPLFGSSDERLFVTMLYRSKIKYTMHQCFDLIHYAFVDVGPGYLSQTPLIPQAGIFLASN